MKEINMISFVLILISAVSIWGFADLFDEIRKLKRRLDKLEKGVSHNIKEE